jgi:precorrin-6A/cobalt-precorrin-6A reductase
MRIWLIGGTSESVAVARRLSDLGWPWIATITTPAAVRLYAGLTGQIRVVTLTPATINSFFAADRIGAIVDASHPFATAISTLAMEWAIARNIPYLRFERPAAPLDAATLLLPDFATLLQPQYLTHRRVFLTTGVKTLHLWRDWHDRAELWARILPTEQSRQQAIAAGFPPHRAIAQRLPITVEEERKLWQRLQVDTVVTKESGAAGGLAVKQVVAAELRVRLIAIARPHLEYPLKTHDLDCLAEFVTLAMDSDTESGGTIDDWISAVKRLKEQH